MGTVGRASQMVFLRNYCALIHWWGGVLLTPTASSLLGSDSQVYCTEGVCRQIPGGHGVMWKVVVFKRLGFWISAQSSRILPPTFLDLGVHRSSHCLSEPRETARKRALQWHSQLDCGDSEAASRTEHFWSFTLRQRGLGKTLRILDSEVISERFW